MFEIGRICMKTAGREAGKLCVVIAKDKDKDFVLITGPKTITKVKRRKCNFRHLEPTPVKIEIKENATDEEVAAAYERDGVLAKLNVKTITISEAKPKLAETAEKKEEHKKEAKHEESKEEKREEKHEHKAEHAHEHKEAKEHEHKEHKEAKPKKARAKKEKKE